MEGKRAVVPETYLIDGYASTKSQGLPCLSTLHIEAFVYVLSLSILQPISAEDGTQAAEEKILPAQRHLENG